MPRRSSDLGSSPGTDPVGSADGDPPAAGPDCAALDGSRPAAGRASWMFLTNHAHVLLAVATDPDRRVAEIAEQVGITTRAALLILHDLEEAGYLRRDRVGRRTHYTIVEHQPLRHPTLATLEVDALVALLSRARRV